MPGKARQMAIYVFRALICRGKLLACLKKCNAPGEREVAPQICMGQALTRYGTPGIVNTDQGSQFTAAEFVEVVAKCGAALSMDGKGAWRDNVFVERLWRTVKYERVYLKAYDTVGKARADIAEYIDWYNLKRAHSSVGDLMLDQAYWQMLPPMERTA